METVYSTAGCGTSVSAIRQGCHTRWYKIQDSCCTLWLSSLQWSIASWNVMPRLKRSDRFWITCLCVCTHDNSNSKTIVLALSRQCNSSIVNTLTALIHTVRASPTEPLLHCLHFPWSTSSISWTSPLPVYQVHHRMLPFQSFHQCSVCSYVVVAAAYHSLYSTMFYL
jgi:hypothetical protein